MHFSFLSSVVFQLKDRETREFIYDFIQNYKVVDAMKSEQSGTRKQKHPAPPPVPVRSQQESQVSLIGGYERYTCFTRSNIIHLAAPSKWQYAATEPAASATQQDIATAAGHNPTKGEPSALTTTSHAACCSGSTHSGTSKLPPKTSSNFLE